MNEFFLWCTEGKRLMWHPILRFFSASNLELPHFASTESKGERERERETDREDTRKWYDEVYLTMVTYP